MTAVQKKTPAAMAAEINAFVSQAGGQPIEGLEQLDPSQLSKIRDGLKQFLDNFDQARAQDPNLAKLADGESIKTLRQLAQIASQQAAANDSCAPNASTTPPAPAKTGPLSNGGANGTINLSSDDVAAANAQINTMKAHVDTQRAQVAQVKLALQKDIGQLEGKQPRSAVEETLLAAKKQQSSLLDEVDKGLDVKKQGLDAAAFAVSDGQVTPDELSNLHTLSSAISGRELQLSQMGGALNQSVQRLQAFAGPVAANGSNFNPLSLNNISAAPIFASALGGGAQAGTISPASVQNIATNLAALANPLAGFTNLGNLASFGAGNLANLGNIASAPLQALANAFAPGGITNGGIGSTNSISDDNNIGTDANLAALQGVGGAGGMFEDRVFAIMCKVVEDFQKQIEQRLQKLQDEADQAQKGGGGGGGGKGGGIGGIIGGVAGSVVGGPIGGMIGSKLGGAVGGAVDGGGGGGGGAGGAGGKGGEESRNIEFEKIKYDMQKLSQMQQAMSNVLDSMNDLAQNAIRKIKGTG